MRGIVVLVVGVVLALPAQVLATYPGTNGKIVFTRNGQLWTMDGDGSNQTPTNFSGYAAQWSSDGRKLAWQCGTAAPICTANADGTGENQLYPGFAVGTLTWSPDGQHLAANEAPFCSHGFCDVPRIYRIESSDGGDPVYYRDGSDPDWSPDGSQIAYNGTGIEQITVIGGNNCCYTRALTSEGRNIEPNWSPDDKIAFVSYRDNAYGEIYTMNADGSAQTRLTSNSALDFDPEWSPDGQKIVFGTNRDGNYEIYSMNADGSGMTRLTNNPATDWNPDWRTIRFAVPRPKGATPTRVPLVPAFKPCTLPAYSHGPPLSYGSCVPPVQKSPAATVGPKSVGYIQLRVVSASGAPSYGPDVEVSVSLTDVRHQSDGTDLTDDLDFPIPLRLTDYANDPHHIFPATMTEFTYFNNPLRFEVPCTPTTDTSVGSTCSLTSTVDSLVPPEQFGYQYVLAGDRAIWQLDQLALYDGGEDGITASLDDNTPLAVQGVFVP